MPADTLIKFEIPKGLQGVLDGIRAQNEIEGDDDLDPGLAAALPFLHEGEVEVTAQVAHLATTAISTAAMVIYQLFGESEITEAGRQLLRNTARALWEQAYDADEKQTVVDLAWREGYDMKDVRESLINTYGAPEAEVRMLLARVGA